MNKIADSQYYDVNWGLMKKVFGNNPSWKREVEFFVHYLDNEQENRSSIKNFREVGEALGIDQPSWSWYTKFLEMIMEHRTPQIDIPEMTEYEDEDAYEQHVLHSDGNFSKYATVKQLVEVD